MRNVSDKICRENQKIHFIAFHTPTNALLCKIKYQLDVFLTIHHELTIH